eukprot:CAMPEP_0167785146 /NCGR_PEP_ID=MMETSP0111_2-20121227/8077_1 /TAXON_ID=91324 /ORGANISM="Lotharella globosa, Strain CCCM811" /LENGTH=307 /DNA_ID=CAMNT_0007676389 /DNA_START=132 /DNA_END=1055 /DNA_ORIENTATION=+
MGEAGQMCDSLPSGMVVSDGGLCEEYAEDMDMTYMTLNSEEYPYGCLKMVDSGDVVFNMNEMGMANANAIPLCMVEEDSNTPGTSPTMPPNTINNVPAAFPTSPPNVAPTMQTMSPTMVGETLSPTVSPTTAAEKKPSVTWEAVFPDFTITDLSQEEQDTFITQFRGVVEGSDLTEGAVFDDSYEAGSTIAKGTVNAPSDEAAVEFSNALNSDPASLFNDANGFNTALYGTPTITSDASTGGSDGGDGTKSTSDDNNDLSSGELAAAIVVPIAVVLAAIGVGYCFCCKSKEEGPTNSYGGEEAKQNV